jgi:uncharacterized protein with PIN domain
MMDVLKFQCENCNAQLLTSDAVCAPCDEKLPGPNINPLIGKYNCPQCHAKFDAPEIFVSAENQKWNGPQTQSLRCPHCKTVLRDRTLVEQTIIEKIGTAVAIALSAIVSNPVFRVVYLISIGVVILLIFLRRKEWKVTVESRYASAEPLKTD